MERRPAKRRSRSAQALGVAASVFVHLAAVVAIVTTPTPKVDLPAARPIDVELIGPPVIMRRTPKVAPVTKLRSVAASEARASRGSAPIRNALVAPPNSQISETHALSAIGAALPGLGTALRGRVGCDHAGFFDLSEDDRRDCRERLVTGRATSAQYAELGIDPQKRAVFDAAWTADHSPQQMAGFACLAKFGGGKIQWAHPSEGVKVPHLPCYFYTPKATFSADPAHKSVW